MTNKNFLYNLYKLTTLIRETELEISKRYSEQEMRCPTHLSVGQELSASVIGLLSNKKDTFVSTHRCHAHYLAKGGSLKQMIAEIYGKAEGCSLGRGGSMHLIDKKVNFMGSSAIVGNSIPIGVGLSHNHDRNDNRISVIFFGDGATEEGSFYESLNISSTFNSPCLFVCEDNLYSVYSSKNSRQPKKRNLKQLCYSLGINYFCIEDYKIEQLIEGAMNLMELLRKKKQPALIDIKTYRFLEHCGPNNDDSLNYRPISEINYFKKKDAYLKLQKIFKKDYGDEILKKIHKHTKTKIDNVFHEVKNLPKPNKKLAFTDVYA